MANINIQDGIISSSADYSIYHGLTKVADIEQDAILTKGRPNNNVYNGWGFMYNNNGVDMNGRSYEGGNITFYIYDFVVLKVLVFL